RRWLQHERHAVVPADPQAGQPGRRVPGPPVQLAVGDRLALGDQGDVIGDGLGGRRQPAVDLHGRLAASERLSLPDMSISWTSAGTYNDIRYETGAEGAEGIAKITIDRPE